MKTRTKTNPPKTNPPNAYDIAANLTDPDNPNEWIAHDVLFEALQKYWTDDGCVARIEEAVADGVLIRSHATRYRLGRRKGLPVHSPERSKIAQLEMIKALLSVFETGERECYCVECFYDFVDEEMEDQFNDSDESEAQTIN